MGTALLIYHGNLEGKELADSLVDPTDADFDVLTHSVMEGIQLARDLVPRNGFRVNTEIPRAGYIIDFAARKALESKKAEAVDLEDGQGQADTDVIKRRFSR